VRILNITNQVPYPVISGAPLRTYNILRRFARNHEIYLAAFYATPEQCDGVAHLREFCRDVVTTRVQRLTEVMNVSDVLAAILQGEPPELRVGFSRELAAEIQKLTARVDFDIVQIEHGSMGMYLDALPARLQKRAVWVLHDIDFDKFMRISQIERTPAKKIRAWVHGTMMKRWQPRVANRFGLCITMSEPDRQVLLSSNSRLQIHVSPNGVDTQQYQPIADESPTSEMLFIGNMGYEPNVDAANYFCNEVLPLVKKKIADPTLSIVGINPTASVMRLASDRVFVTGSVPDVVPYYRRSRICVVPLRAGSGTRLKILEAMALGRAVVSTPVGCEGLGVRDGENILVADSPELFAHHVVRLLTDCELRARIAARAREFVVESYDWDIITGKLLNALRGVATEDRECELRDHRKKHSHDLESRNSSEQQVCSNQSDQAHAPGMVPPREVDSCLF